MRSEYRDLAEVPSIARVDPQSHESLLQFGLWIFQLISKVFPRVVQYQMFCNDHSLGQRLYQNIGSIY